MNEQQNKVQFEQKLLVNEKKVQYQVVKCDIGLSYSNQNQHIFISLFSQFGLKNECEHEIVFGWGDNEFVLAGKESLILPGSYENLIFKEKEEAISLMPK